MSLRRSYMCTVMLTAGLILLTAVPCDAAEFTGVMIVTGAKQGRLNGRMEILGFSMQAASPSGMRSGMSAGKRQHKPIMIKKLVDSSSPQLMQALRSNEVLQVEIDFNPPKSLGKESPAKAPAHLKLKNAIVTGIHLQPKTAGKAGTEIEEVTLSYEEIEWTNTNGAKSMQDDWEQRN